MQTKEQLLQLDDEYWIKIESQSEQDIVEKVFKDNKIPLSMKTRFKENEDNFYISNQNTWTSTLSSDYKTIIFNDWFNIVSKSSSLTEFEPNKLYELRTFEDLKQEFGTKDNVEDEINISPTFTKKMEEDQKLNKFFLPT